jgi:hypothetical protein
MAQVMEHTENNNETAASNSGYFDAFVGLAGTYVNARFSESSREQPEINEARGNTDTIYQPTKGSTYDGETIVVKDATNYKKIGAYAGVGLGSLLVLAVAYKAVK